MGSLTEDPAFLSITFVVINFEATTPAGHPAQPIEVAALAFRYRQCWASSGPPRTQGNVYQPVTKRVANLA